MDTLHLLEAKRHFKLNVGCCVGIVSKLLVVVVAIFMVAHTERLVPLQAGLFPLLEPLQLFTWAHKELHLHLLKLTHTEDKLACYNLVAESLSYLGNSEWNTHTARLLHIKVVHEDSLCSLGAQIHRHCTIGCTTHLCLEHKVELAHIGPVLCSRNRANNSVIYDNLLQLHKVVGIHSLCKTLVQFIALLLVLKHSRIG